MPPHSDAGDTSTVEGEEIAAGPSASTIGLHLIIDFWQAKGLTDVVHIEAALRDAAKAASATVLDVSLHEFANHDGITGVALLAESHISVHTWPEHGYAAFDVFICGSGDAYRSLDVLKERFCPDAFEVQEIARGSRRQDP